MSQSAPEISDQTLSLLAFDAAPVGIVLSEDRVIRACNARFAELFGYPRAALLGESFRMLYPSGGDFDRVRDIGLEPLKQAATYSDERIMRHASGKPIWFRFRAQTLTPDAPLSRVVMSFAPLARAEAAQSLTPRERDVISGLSRGLTSKEIARELGLSPRSIEDVRARLLKKFEVRNASALLARLSHLG
ncbi:LuxR C-terminal-related transcriptional regulator [Litorivita sp. NS0012-18]|uniref:LuxR C-terminal-related transcriptional regulator n=1 Tax=Litorivita sp. NS0012-18 TaxID=3127655 RepID=UPI0031049401